MKKPQLTLFLLLFVFNGFAQTQKIIADYTITYAVSNPDNKENLENAVKVVYVSGKQIRIDLSSNTFNQTIFYNDNTGEATVLKSIGESKYISTYSSNDWEKQNAVYSETKISFTNKTKKILNYKCKEALLQLNNGNSYVIYYVPGLLPSVTENVFQSKNIPGLILEYQADTRNEKIQYTASALSFDPVPAFKFEIPKSGYKILSD